ncbi:MULTISPECIES: hypothetical protein [Mycobacterium]|uniref:Uncharacterized protein n=1 Tax=Mycobacterium colombiense TaxID=339268 RepID=A0A329M167_9MYCO|nr:MULTISPECIES: hypothetical protein [Mycobacterium]MDM4139644.1 hypothetical protein [Mycobacterium sp. FLAC0960]RAV13362.1 hypothetical protein DQP57_07785 [Mycobacterium colombiense]
MRTLLEFYLNYFDFLYLDPRYRITNSKTGNATINGSLTVTGPIITWLVVNDRGQMQISLAPTCLALPRNWFWVSLIKQYINHEPEIEYLSATDEVEWMRQNATRVEELFCNASTVANVCEELKELRRANADKYWSQ